MLAASCSDDVGAIFCIPRSALQGMIPSELARKARLSALTHDSITPTCSVCGPNCIRFLVASVLDPDSGGGLIMRQSSYPKPGRFRVARPQKYLRHPLCGILFFLSVRFVLGRYFPDPQVAYDPAGCHAQLSISGVRSRTVEHLVFISKGSHSPRRYRGLRHTLYSVLLEARM